jgi:cation diffusion facilitator family transporter
VNKSSKTVVLTALGANVAIAVAKGVVAAVTGSAAMVAETIHSSVDTGNEFLMLLGARRSRRPPDESHPFGHGKELYFWSLMVAVLIFGLGGGISAVEGIEHVLSPKPVEHPGWNYALIGISSIFEGISFWIALQVFMRENRSRKTLVEKVVDSKDPTTFTVLAEDSAALVGLLIAGMGIYLSKLLDMPELDGVASILIGILLASVAYFLIRECRKLLVGEGVDPQTLREVRKIVLKDPLVESVRHPLTMYLGPDTILLTLDVQFQSDASASDVADAIDRTKNQIRKRFPKMKRIYLEAETAAEARA